MIKIDGSRGEGGGAILRQALALSTITGKPFEMSNIRSNRPVPGLKAQHMHSLIALEKLTKSSVTNCEIGAEKITFIPGKVKGKTINVDVGTAGSISLLLQALVLPAVFSGETTTINVTGGTDVKWSVPIDYFSNVFIPILKNYAEIDIRVIGRGYYPKGGGKVTIRIKSLTNTENLKPLELLERGELIQIRGVSHSSSDLMGVADKQANEAEILLTNSKVAVRIDRQYSHSLSPGSGITLWAMYGRDDQEISKPMFLGGDCLGEKNKTSEAVAKTAVENLKREMNSNAVVDEYLADQLIPLLGLTKGAIKTSKITKHTVANIYVAEKFLKVIYEIDGKVIRVS